MRAFLVLLMLAFSFPVTAQEKKAEKKPAAKKAEKKAEKKPAKKVEKTTAEPKQEWGRFSSNAQKDMKAMDEKKAAKK